MKKLLFINTLSNKKILLILFSVLLTVSLYSEIKMYHQSLLTINLKKNSTIEVEIQDGFTEIQKMYIHYREIGEFSYNKFLMEKGTMSNPIFYCDVNDLNVKNGLEYYFVAHDEDFVRHYLPQENAGLNPYRVKIKKKTDYCTDFIKLAPEYKNIDPEEFVVAISVFAMAEMLDYDTIQMFVDNKDVTSAADIGKNMIVYKDKTIKPGKHFFYLKAQLKNGKTVTSKKWEVDVSGKIFQLPLNINGRSTISYKGSNTERDSTSDSDDRFNFSLNFSGRKKWFRFGSRLFLSSLESSNAQPINRYNIRLMTPKFDLILGDYSPNLGSFIMNSTNLRGITAKLHLNKFRLFISQGNIKREIEEDKFNLSDSTYATNNSFKRKTLGLFAEMGPRDGFNWGFSFVKNKDDENSLDEDYYLTADSARVVTPKDNVVFGTHLKMHFMNSHLVLGGEAAMSLYNSDILDGAISQDSLETLLGDDIPVNPEDFESIFVINKNAQPFLPSFSNVSFRLYMRAMFYHNLLNVSFSQVGSSFNSLSSNFFNSDIKTININDNINLLNNQLNLNLGLNLSSDNVNDSKETTTSFTNYYSQLSYTPYNIPFFRVGFSGNISENDADSDDDKYETVSNDFFFGTGYELGNLPVAPTKLNITFSNNQNIDKAQDSYEYKRNIVNFSTKSHFVDLPLTTSLSYSLSLNEDEIAADSLGVLKSNYNSFYIKNEVSIVQNRLKPYLDFRYTKYGGDIEDQSISMFNLGSSYQMRKNTYLYSELGLKSYSSDIENSEYTKYNWNFKISQKF